MLFFFSTTILSFHPVGSENDLLSLDLILSMVSKWNYKTNNKVWNLIIVCQNDDEKKMAMKKKKKKMLKKKKKAKEE